MNGRERRDDMRSPEFRNQVKKAVLNALLKTQITTGRSRLAKSNMIEKVEKILGKEIIPFKIGEKGKKVYLGTGKRRITTTLEDMKKDGWIYQFHDNKDQYKITTSGRVALEMGALEIIYGISSGKEDERDLNIVFFAHIATRGSPLEEECILRDFTWLQERPMYRPKRIILSEEPEKLDDNYVQGCMNIWETDLEETKQILKSYRSTELIEKICVPLGHFPEPERIEVRASHPDFCLKDLTSLIKKDIKNPSTIYISSSLAPRTFMVIASLIASVASETDYKHVIYPIYRGKMWKKDPLVVNI